MTVASGCKVHVTASKKPETFLGTLSVMYSPIQSADALRNANLSEYWAKTPATLKTSTSIPYKSDPCIDLKIGPQSVILSGKRNAGLLNLDQTFLWPDAQYTNVKNDLPIMNNNRRIEGEFLWPNKSYIRSTTNRLPSNYKVHHRLNVTPTTASMSDESLPCFCHFPIQTRTCYPATNQEYNMLSYVPAVAVTIGAIILSVFH